jgi:hypothetical protein
MARRVGDGRPVSRSYSATISGLPLPPLAAVVDRQSDK